MQHSALAHAACFSIKGVPLLVCLCVCFSAQPDGSKVTAGVGLLGGEVNKLLSDHAK